MGMPPYKIELITSIDGVSFQDCYTQRQVVELDGIQVCYLSLEDLRKNKLASGRFKDLDGLQHLPKV